MKMVVPGMFLAVVVVVEGVGENIGGGWGGKEVEVNPWHGLTLRKSGKMLKLLILNQTLKVVVAVQLLITGLINLF